MNGIKQDPSVKQDPSIKQDPMDTESPGTYEGDMDTYEDDNELTVDERYDPFAWLLRVDNELWKALSSLSADEEIEIGKIKVIKDTRTKKERTELELNRGVPAFQDVFKEYYVNITNSNPLNTYVFSEKDLPGYKPGRKTGAGAGNRIQKGKPRPRRSIPKQTALQAALKYELATLPIETPEWERLKITKDRALQPEVTSEMRTTMEEFNKLNNAVKQQQSNVFLKLQDKKKKKKEKFVRAERQQLLDMIFNCFRQYRAWGLRTMKENLRQPEGYLREVLETVATLHRSGDLVNTYTLKPDYLSMEGLASGGVAPEEESDDDDDDEMEDVVKREK